MKRSVAVNVLPQATPQAKQRQHILLQSSVEPNGRSVNLEPSTNTEHKGD